MPVPMTANGVSITFGTSNFTAEITNFTPPGWEVADIPTTHAGTEGAKTFMPGDLPDNGELSMTVHFDPANPPVRGPAEAVEIEFNDGTTWDFSGYIKSYAPSGVATEGDEKIEADITVKVSGEINVNGGS